MEGKRKKNLSKYNLSPAMELILQQQIQKLRERMGLKKLKSSQDTENSSQTKTASNLVKDEGVTSEASSTPLDQESPASSSSAPYYALSGESFPMQGQPQKKVSSPDRSVVRENLQLHSYLSLEDSKMNDIGNAQNDEIYGEPEESLETSREKPEVKKPRMTEGQLHHCTKCEKIFNTAWELVLHYEAHLTQHNYKCDICGVAVFNYAAPLWAHKKECKRNVEHFEGNSRELSPSKENSTLQSQLHQIAPAARNKFPCDICPRRFSQAYTLKEHKDVVHFGKRYCCRFCDKEFCSRSYFRQHEKACEQNQMAK